MAIWLTSNSVITGGGGGTGEANTGSNLSTSPAVGVYDSKSGVALRFNGVAGEQVGNNILPWEVFRIVNETGAPLSKGYAVTATSVTAGVYSATHLDPSVEAHRENYLGLVLADVADTASGYAIRFGLISSEDTSSWSALDTLYVSTSTDGQLTNVDPTGDSSFPVGMVKTVNATTGVVNAVPRAGSGAGGGTGDVVGPASATDGTPAIWDGTTGKLLKSGGADYIDYEPQSSDPAYQSGRRWFDGASPRMWTYITGQSVQTVGEIPRQIYNTTGSTIPAGKAVSFVSVYVSPTAGPISGIGLTDALDRDSVGAFVGVTKHSIDAGDEGIAYENGLIAPVDTAAWGVGDLLYVDPASPGDLTNVFPSSPAFAAKVGFVPISDASGAIGVVPDIGDNFQDVNDYWVGCTLHKNSVVITSDGATITAAVQKDGGGDIVIFKDGGELVTIDTIPAVDVALTAGGDTSPQENWIYIDHADDTIKASTAAPSGGGYALLWFGSVKSATYVQASGLTFSQRTSNEIHDDSNNGDAVHISQRLRKESAVYESGMQMTFTRDAVPTPDSITTEITPGTGWQKHLQTWNAIANPATFTVWNDSDAAYTDRTDINQILKDSTGAAWTTPKSFFSLYWWAAISSPDPSEGKLYCTLPSGDYTTLEAARADSLLYVNRSVPTLADGKAIPLYETIIQVTGSGNTWTVEETRDIRGSRQGASAGGGAINAIVNFPDNQFTIFDADNALAILNYDLAALTATRVVSPQDAAMTIPTTAEHTDLTDGGDSTLHYHAADRDRANHTGTQTASTISGFDTEVSNNTDVAANTSARHARAHSLTSTSDHNDVATDTPVKNDVLMFDGSEWQAVPEGTSFEFSIATFTDNEAASIIEIGTGTWKAIGAISLRGTYNNGPPSAAPTVQLSGQFSAWTSPLALTTAPDYTDITASLEAIAYPSGPSSSAGVMTLSATDGIDPDTATNNFYFYNNRFWDVDTTASSITEATIEGFAGSELSNSRVKTFSVTAAAGEYIWYCYPSRLGAATFTVGGFEGGFESAETVSITNPSGYTENYYCYRSTNSGLGSTTVGVS